MNKVRLFSVSIDISGFLNPQGGSPDPKQRGLGVGILRGLHLGHRAGGRSLTLLVHQPPRDGTGRRLC